MKRLVANVDLYAAYHPRGSKRMYDWRLEGLDRAAEAGLGRLGLGILLGLSDPRDDLLALSAALLELVPAPRRSESQLPRE